MGKLADDMVQLSKDIQEMRAERQVFVEDLKETVANMRAGFRKEQIEMARQTRTERQAVIDDLRMAQRAWSQLGTVISEARESIDQGLSEEEMGLNADTSDTPTRQSKKARAKKSGRRNS